MKAPLEERGADIARGATLAGIAAFFAACFLHAFQAAGREGERMAVVLAMLLCSSGWNLVAALLTRGRRTSRSTRRSWWTTVFFLAACTVAGNYGVSAALAHLVPGVTSVLLQTQVFVVALMSRAFLAERLSRVLLVGAALAVSGVIVISIEDLGEPMTSSALRGIPLALLGTVSFAAMLVWTRAVIRDMAPVPLNATRLLLSSAVLLLLPGNWRALQALTPAGWGWAAAAAACGPFISRLLLMEAVRYISASRTKLISLLSPIFAFAISGVLYGTVPALRELGGAVLILLGVILPTALGRLDRRGQG